MKRMIVLWLCVGLMVVAMGCANSAAGGDAVGGLSNAADGEQGGQADNQKTTEEAKQSEETMPLETESKESQSEENVAAFDTSWAGNEFERQLEQPPFEKWEVKEFVEGESWRIFVQDVHYNVAKEYANDLRSFGFTVNEEEKDGYSGLAYIFEADNASGYHAKLVFEAGDPSGMGSFSLKISKE